jgi:HSP20 family molecular chaperone IbpA
MMFIFVENGTVFRKQLLLYHLNFILKSEKGGLSYDFRRVNTWPAWHWRNQWGEMDRLRRELNALVDGSYGQTATEPSAGVFPLMNVTEDGNNFYIRAELPGMKPTT